MRSFLIPVLALTWACPARMVAAQITLLSPLENDYDAIPGRSYSGTITLRNDSNEP